MSTWKELALAVAGAMMAGDTETMYDIAATIVKKAVAENEAEQGEQHGA